MRSITPDRFLQGRTFAEYLEYVGSPENLEREAFGGYQPEHGASPAKRPDNSSVFAERYARARLSPHQGAAIRWLAAKSNGPANILVLSEDWSSDCRRDIPWIARLAEAGGLELRIFNRDGARLLTTRMPAEAPRDSAHDLVALFPNRKNENEFASVPVVAVFNEEFQELHTYFEYPAIYHKDRIRDSQRAARGDESALQATERSNGEFRALQDSPFFDLWASAAVDEILSALFEKLTIHP